VESVTRKHKLLEAFFADLQKYKQEEQDGGSNRKKKPEKKNKKKQARAGPMRYTHMQQIKIRLSFLELLLVSSSATLTAAQVRPSGEIENPKKPNGNRLLSTGRCAVG